MTKISAHEIGDFVGAIYRSAYDKTEWPETIERMRRLFRGSTACLARIGPDLGPDDAIAANTDPTFQLRVMTDFPMGTIELGDAVAGAPVGLIYRDETILGPGELRRTRFWNEWMAPQDMYGGLGIKLLARDQSCWIWDVQRGRRQERFSDGDMALFAYIAPHVTRAVEIARNIEASRAMGSFPASLSLGVVVVDGDLKVLSINPAGEAMLARPGCPLRRCRGGLKADARSAATLQRLTIDACTRRKGAAPGFGGDLVLRADPQIDGAVDLALCVAPATGGADLAGLTDRTCFIIIRELSLTLPESFAIRVREAFGLTAREAEVAASLAAGQSLKDIAQAVGTSPNTVRSHLDRVFRKTQTRQQSELVALLKTFESLGRVR